MPNLLINKKTKDQICVLLNKTMIIIQEQQKLTDLQVSPVTKEEKTLEKQLKSSMPNS
ncbi:PREDICTED: spindle and kinetochore-associated protein 2-like [Elephantulus edwardii]|uniref:spindle and kinetochore-associated protein 2-like n=1 Tax=Elephantulus edwardii TaxID=28737 RepID=UPI0003F0849F|nr:PREDICTED: spindle and kinetochore-associated protein 2-like [Elephantulus edwardii]